MIKYTRRNVNIDQEILEAVSKSENWKYNDITTNKSLLDKRSKSTLEKRVSFLKENDILQKKNKIYKVNPYITDYSKAYKQQIKEGEKKETDHKKLLENSLFKEAELRNRITRRETTEVFKDFGELNNEIFFSNESNLFSTDIFYSFLRERIIFNPELWEKLIKPAHFNFRFMLKCNWEKDPEIFNLINDLKDIYKKIGYIPHNVNAPFHREEKTKLNSEADDEYYMKAISQETIRSIIEEKENKFFKETQENGVAFLNYLKPFFKKIEGIPEMHDLVYISKLLFSQPIDKLKNPTIEERKESSEKHKNSLLRIKKMVCSLLEIED